jgi:branched-chain amino acid transport system permease protein
VIAGALGGLRASCSERQVREPSLSSWQRSGELLIMVIFGGMGTLNGAIISAAAFSRENGFPD